MKFCLDRIYIRDSVCSLETAFISGKNESLRARAILRSLVPLDDLQGVLSLRFTLLNPAAGEERPKSDTPSGLIPGHKQSVVLFLERVYGIETQELFYKILEEAFLPDLRAATMLDRVCCVLYRVTSFEFYYSQTSFNNLTKTFKNRDS